MRAIRKLLSVCVMAAWFVAAIAQTDIVKRQVAFTAPKRWALVIGAGNYTSLGKLTYAPNDASSFSKALIEDFQFPAESVTTLTDEAGSKQPTVDHIRQELDRLLNDARLNQGDLFILYFSGHGIGTPSGDYLAPTDATEESIEKVGLPIKEVVAQFASKGLRNVLVIADACRAGKKNEFGKELSALGEKTNIGVMLACQPGGKSYEWSRQGHGFFTYYLLQALKRQELRQQSSGALWASEVGKWISGKVVSATEDTFTPAQAPAIQCDDRRDVMLGAFIPKNLETEVVEQFKDKILDSSKLASALSDYAQRLYESGRYFESAEMLRTVDGLQALEDGDRLTLSLSLSQVGRDNESEIQLGKLRASKGPIAQSLGVFYSKKSSLERKHKSAINLLEAVPSINVATALIQDMGDIGEGPYRTDLIERILSKFKDVSPQTASYFRAELAYEKNDLESAEHLFRESFSQSGLPFDPEVPRVRLFTTLTRLYKFKEAVDHCEEMSKASLESNKKMAGTWLVLKASVERWNLMDKVSAAATVGRALDFDLDPNELISALNAGGLEGATYASKFHEQARRFPRSWEALLVEKIVTSFEEGSLEFVISEDSPIMRYVDDPKRVAIGFETAIFGIWEDSISSGAMPPEVYQSLLILKSGNLMTLARSFPEDEHLMWYATLNGIRAFRTHQLQALYKAKVYPSLESKTVSAQKASSYLMVAFNGCDWPVFDKILGSKKLVGSDALNAPWLDALSQLIRGREDSLKALVPTLKDPTQDFRPMAEALKIYVKSRKETPEKAATLLAGLEMGEDTSANALIGLAWLKLGDVEKARPLLEESLSMMNWAFQGLHSYAVSQLGQALRQEKSEEADAITYFMQFTQPAHPATQPLTYGQNPTLDSYAGKFTFTGRRVNDDTKIERVKGYWTISSKGQLAGNIGTIAISGSVDQKGNFIGNADEGGKKWQVIGKLAPKTYYQTFEPLRGENLVILLQAEDGERLVFALQVSP